MKLTLTKSARMLMSAVVLTAGLTLDVAYGQSRSASSSTMAADAMPRAQQTALVQKYCAVCHTDAVPSGGLSLDGFDAARIDPGVAAMLVSKLKGGAMSAAGLVRPDQATHRALVSALSAEAAGAGEWTLTQTQDRTTKSPILTGGIVREVPSATNVEADLYRLTVRCSVDTRVGEIQLAWAPGDVTETGGVISAVVDGKAPLSFKAYQGEGAVILSSSKQPGLASMALPVRSLTISSLFSADTVEFPFASLPQTARQTLATCFSGRIPQALR